MVNVHDYAHNLAKALRDSPEHKAFAAAKSRVKAKPSAENMVADIHKKQMELQGLVIQGKEPTEEQKEALQRLYGIVSGDPDVRDYLMAEQRLGMLVQDIYKILGEAIDADLPG